jgi:hypothetical protein
VRAVVEKAEIPMRLRRKRNGNVSVVADNGGEQLPQRLCCVNRAVTIYSKA